MWANITAMLDDAGMAPTDIVSLTTWTFSSVPAGTDGERRRSDGSSGAGELGQWLIDPIDERVQLVTVTLVELVEGEPPELSRGSTQGQDASFEHSPTGLSL